MSDPLSSPGRPAVKITYMERQKVNGLHCSGSVGLQKKRKMVHVVDDSPNSDYTPTTQTNSTSTGITEGSMKPPSKGSVSKGPKKIDFHLPGPAPKPIQPDNEDTDATKASLSEQPKKPSHNRSTSSISSLARVVQKVVTSSSAPTKPSSVKVAKPSSSRRTATPETEMDDNVSIADSVVTISVGKIRRTETERIEYFRNQSECSTLEPHRALCTRCNKFVNLGRNQTYAVRPWETHRTKCDQQIPSSNTKGSDIRLQSELGDEEGDDASTVDPSASCRALRKTLAERKAILDADSRVTVVKSDEVKCRKCEKWIRLSSTIEYALGNWNKHALSCCDAVPSSRVATATRKLHLVNDSQAKSFGVHNVQCGSCDSNVDLGQEIDYDLSKWEEHKSQCHAMKPMTNMTDTSPDLKSGASNTEPVLSSDRPPRSSASTETTLVASDPTQPSPVLGTKRIRDEPDLPAGDPDVRPSNRPRSETYVPPEKEAPGPMGWFLLPFKAFLQGFRESLHDI
ncbi:hypothetical protein L208DRAFT_1406440 [Tricholoma matsutake]|nr:hypothetical protein L208DRAFT_1406440 [Tricholoma matsutake 945]